MTEEIVVTGESQGTDSRDTTVTVEISDSSDCRASVTLATVVTSVTL